MARFLRELTEAVKPGSAAELRAAGVSPDMLRGARWTRTARGFYRPASPVASTATQRILDVAARLPNGAVIGGWAAAYALGVDRLDGLDLLTLEPLPVTVLLPPRMRRRSQPGVSYVQSGRRPVKRVTIDGIPFTAERGTALDLARWATDVTEAVVALDAFLSSRVLARQGLDSGAATLGGLPGAKQARQAIGLSRCGVRSSWETRLRMFYVCDLGLPPPEVNQPVFDLDGNFLGAPDLLDEEAGLAVEYDGARWSVQADGGHRDREQHREDNAREELLERAGLIVVRSEKADLTRFRARLAKRITAARDDGRSRDRRRDRWTTQPPPDWCGLPA